ncbi:MAG: hypothetical protein WCA09_12470 [Burkholderiales bacterium]
MQRHYSRILALLVSVFFAVFAASALAGSSGGQEKESKVSKEYCQKNPDDPRCKETKY